MLDGTASDRIERVGTEEEYLNLDSPLTDSVVLSVMRAGHEYSKIASLLCVVTLHDDSPFR